MPRGRRNKGNMKISTFEKKYGLPLEAMRGKRTLTTVNVQEGRHGN